MGRTMIRRRSRREILSLAALGALLPARNGFAQRPGKIDVHHHVGPPPNATGSSGGAGGPAWSPEIAIEEMDRNGVATGIGFPGPIPVSTDLERGRKQAREYNEYA